MWDGGIEEKKTERASKTEQSTSGIAHEAPHKLVSTFTEFHLALLNIMKISNNTGLEAILADQLDQQDIKMITEVLPPLQMSLTLRVLERK